MTITLDVSDPKAAKKALNAAIKAEKRQRELDQVSSDKARDMAMANGYRVLSCKLEGRLDHWDRFDANTSYFRAMVKPHAENANLVMVDTRGGYIAISQYSSDVVSIVADCGGHVLAVFMQERGYFDHDYRPDPNGKVTAYAIGGCDGHSSLQDLPTITLDDFKPFVSNA